MNNTDQSFDYVNLAEVDPNQESLPEGVYTFKILKAELKEGVGKTSGKPYSCVNMALAIADHPTFAGRRIWETFFPNTYGLKALRRIQDATGVLQAPGQPLVEWLAALSQTQPEFKTFLKQEPDIDRATGNPRSYGPDGITAAIKNAINAFQIVPA